MDNRPGHPDELRAELLVSEWVHGDLPSEAIPPLAIRALEAGCDSPALRRLAGESGRVTRSELESLVARLFSELGFHYPDARDASAFLVNHWAELIAERRVEPYRGARQLWLLSHDWWEQPEWHRLSIFVGLASEWEDDPERRRDYEAEIVSEAQKFVGEGGFTHQE